MPPIRNIPKENTRRQKKLDKLSRRKGYKVYDNPDDARNAAKDGRIASLGNNQYAVASEVSEAARKPPEILSRPQGTPPERATNVTNLPPEQQEAVSRRNAIIGQTRRELEAQQIRKAAELQARQESTLTAELPPPETAELGRQQKTEQILRNTLLGENASFEEFLNQYNQANPDEQIELERGFFDLIKAAPPGVLGAISGVISGDLTKEEAIRREGISLGIGAAGVTPLAAPRIIAAAGITPIATGAGGGSLLSGLTKLTGIGGAAIFFKAGTGGKISEIEGDITSLRTSTEQIATSVISQGADPADAINQIKIIEADMVRKGAALHLAVGNDPISAFSGKTIEPFFFEAYNKVQLRRQALERYELDGDFESLKIALGQGGVGLQ